MKEVQVSEELHYEVSGDVLHALENLLENCDTSDLYSPGYKNHLERIIVLIKQHIHDV